MVTTSFKHISHWGQFVVSASSDCTNQSNHVWSSDSITAHFDLWRFGLSRSGYRSVIDLRYWSNISQKMNVRLE